MSADRARAAVRRAFSARGRKTYWPYLNQKGYAYAQTLERDLRIDMRIIVIGPLLLGYYRDAPPYDFRASGMGLVREEALPADALEEAWRISRGLGVGAVSVDFITDRDLQQRKVTEFSTFNRIDSAEDCKADGVSGVYVRQGEGCFAFRPGRYWMQELALAQALAQTCGIDADRLLLDSIEAMPEVRHEPVGEEASP
jgi:hypothetical protein